MLVPISTLDQPGKPGRSSARAGAASRQASSNTARPPNGRPYLVKQSGIDITSLFLVRRCYPIFSSFLACAALPSRGEERGLGSARRAALTSIRVGIRADPWRGEAPKLHGGHGDTESHGGEW